MEIIKQSPKIIDKVSEFLKNGGVVICPTDTVYGFLAYARNKKAVERIYKIKKRPGSKPLSVFVKDLKMAKELAEISKEQAKILTLRFRSGQAKFWPGKYTFILKRKKFPEVRPRGVLRLYGVAKDTIAIRIPKYKFLNDLLKKINRPLVQTSVNISGQEPFKSINAILTTFGKSRLLGLIIEGGSANNAKPSKIIDLTGNKIKILRK